MRATALRSRLRRLLTVLGISLVAAGTTVMLSAAPAHAALVYQGTFTIRDNTGLCVGLQNNGTARQTPIVMQGCDGSSGQRWAIFLATDQNNYWIQAHGGAQPLNMCMDSNGSPANKRNMWIWNCNGGTNQRFSPSIGSTPSWIFGGWSGDPNGQGTLSCVNSTTAGPLVLRGCGSFPAINGTQWTLSPA